MNQIDTDESMLSEPSGGQSGADSLKLVPVAESIRYRKRAQAAERKNEELSEALAQARSEAAQIAEQLTETQVEQQLMRKLAAAGTVDLEAAVVIAKARMNGQNEVDIDGVIEQLKAEKQYLFAGRESEVVGMTAQKTAGVKDRVATGRSALERAAKKAAATGNRVDLQHYLKLRRAVV